MRQLDTRESTQLHHVSIASELQPSGADLTGNVHRYSMVSEDRLPVPTDPGGVWL